MKKIVGKIWQNIPRFVRLKIIRLTQHKFVVSVGVVVTNERKEVLLLDHVLRPASGWGIPGGFMLYNEQPIEAVRRELREETGLEIKNVEIIWVRTLSRHIEILFRAESDGKAEVKSREIKGLGWFDPEQMPAEISTAQKQLVKKILNTKKKIEKPD